MSIRKGGRKLIYYSFLKMAVIILEKIIQPRSVTVSQIEAKKASFQFQQKVKAVF